VEDLRVRAIGAERCRLGQLFSFSASRGYLG
jgi:hypothetical protein